MSDWKRHLLTLGHSPDPDDAFMFYALAENKIDTQGYRFKHVIEDIQTLNDRAMRGELHVSAVSIHALAYVLDKYALLPSGASMGDGYGPLIVARSRDGLGDAAGYDEVRAWLAGKTIASPGELTSAHLAFRLFMGDPVPATTIVPFDKIFDAIGRGGVDAGIIIHEGQLTYAEHSCSKIVDLGQWWKDQTKLPLPLGGNVVRKDIDRNVRSEIATVLKESISYGLQHREEAVRHSMPLARGMAQDKVDKFIGMYVNDYTLDYGESGRKAIREFLGLASEYGYIPAPVELEFVQ